jgi:signal transduction histidine kinase
MPRLTQVPQQGALAMLQLAHELRSPLASIQTALDMILQGYARDDAQLQDEMLNLARDRAVVMLGQVNEFLRLGAIQHSEHEGKAGPVQLLGVLSRLIPEKRVRAMSRAVDLVVEVPDSLSMVHAAPEDLEHLVSNLIDNAIKYTNPGGRVTVRLREDERNVIGVVEDTGIGIAREDLSKIFDGFYRTGEAKNMGVDGTGLGLSIAKQVVDRYSGCLDVESELGQGSRFRFAFPKAEPVRGLAVSQGTEVAGTKVGLFHNLQKEVIAQGLCA